MNIRLVFISFIAFAASAVAQTSNKAVMTLGDQTIHNTKTLDGFVISGSGSLVTQPGAPVRIGGVALLWNDIASTVAIEGDANHHGLIVHTSGTQGNAIVGFSQSGAAAVKAWQDTYAASPAIIIGRSAIDPTPGLAPLIVGVQGASLTCPLLKLAGSGEFDVFADGAVKLGGSAPAASSSPGVPGQIAWDGSYFYLCTGTNQWKRTALSSW